MHVALLVASILAAVAQPAATARIVDARISPDGLAIAFSRETSGDAAGLYRIAFAGGEELRLLAGRVSAVRWSPDGAEIGCVFRATLTAPGVVRIVSASAGTGRTIAPAGRDIETFEWSADGQWLLLQSRPDDDRGRAPRIDVVSASGDRSQPSFPVPPTLPAGPVVAALPGTQVLFTSTAGKQRAATIGNGVETWIDVVDAAAGTRVTVMPAGLARILGPSSWSSDGGRFVVVASGDDHGPEVFAGSRPRTVTGVDSPGAAPPAVRRLTFSRFVSP
jgi:dipeptidyl aminopeptidase/acylaminoacyl peptidase